MNETNQGQVIFVASVDFACIGTGHPEDQAPGLDGAAVLAGPGGWAGLQEAAKLQEGDDPGCDGYLVKAWATDPTTSALIHFEEWPDLCQDQVSRIWESMRTPACKE